MALMIAPKKLSEWPWVVVRIDCRLCSRMGCYRLARLAARYGPEMPLETLLAALASDCPWWRVPLDRRKYDPYCGARFVDLDCNLPPPDDPEASLHRQRGPGQEDLPQRRVTGPAWNGDVPRLSGWPSPMIRVVCSKCGRRDTFVKADVLLNTDDERLTDLLRRLTADCPRSKAVSIYELCGARFEVPG